MIEKVKKGGKGDTDHPKDRPTIKFMEYLTISKWENTRNWRAIKQLTRSILCESNKKKKMFLQLVFSLH